MVVYSKGSVLVDYVVEFKETGATINTQQMKRLFHEILNATSAREGKSLNESKAEKLTLGQFELDPKFTDFIGKMTELLFNVSMIYYYYSCTERSGSDGRICRRCPTAPMGHSRYSNRVSFFVVRHHIRSHSGKPIYTGRHVRSVQ